MLLAIDVGNTNIVIGVFQRDELVHSWRLTTIRERTADELGILVTDLCDHHEVRVADISGIVIGSVVPPLTGTMSAMAVKYFRHTPLVFEPSVNGGMPILYDNPAEVGADRIVNGVAGVVKYGSPLIVVDFGTATTFDFLNKAKVYKGGCICPGIAISNEALFQHASKLPRVEIRKPSRIIGSNTVESIQAGIFYGYVGMVDEIVRRMQKEAKTKCKVVATGGFIGLISKASRTISAFDPYLTLEGLRLLYEFNRKGRKSGKK